MILTAARRPLLAATFLFAACNAVNASDLGDSMRRYFGGDFQGAHQQLTQLIAAGQADARAYYFRGLANFRLGNQPAAASDFQQAATIEFAGPDDNIGASLERVQGMDRLVLEKYRTLARLTARNRSQPVAPKPIQFDNLVQPATANLAVAKSEIRLGSEIPLRPLRNPFVDEAATAKATKSATKPQTNLAPNDEKPVGTGVASETAADPDFDPFAMDEPSAENVPASSGNAISAAFRAIGKAFLTPSSSDDAGDASNAANSIADDPFDIDAPGAQGDEEDPFDVGDLSSDGEDDDPFGDF